MKKKSKCASPLEKLLAEKMALQKASCQAVMNLKCDWQGIQGCSNYLFSEWISSRLISELLYFI